METVEVQSASIPSLGFGTYELEGKTAERMVACALEAGYRHVDTARMYGNEAEVGRGLRSSGVPRREVFLTTKLWHDELKKSQVRPAVEDSLRALTCDYVDLLLVHWPNPDVYIGKTLEAMQELKKEGKVRHIGVSNFPADALAKAAQVPGVEVVCDQVEYHPFLDQSALLAATGRLGMALVAYCPLAQGEVLGAPMLREVARKHGASEAQVALRWLLDQPRVAAIPRSSDPEHCRENLGALELLLDEEDRTKIAMLAGDHRLIDPSFAPEWDEAA